MITGIYFVLGELGVVSALLLTGDTFRDPGFRPLATKVCLSLFSRSNTGLIESNLALGRSDCLAEARLSPLV